ncbi:hypothetical protein [Candidatus Enterovibrio escicola]|uniref:Uncharacterized protein n=1 Tax=Candidatus Enterovibrio escicola TaxID=1927127 RepID=A0A2A5T6R1_9GAMM|nr:hypothetical protein [Candidatus Enterovibrio escacola]PCS23816.1 hypothetical protein BTN49_0785 [Candidatus Enterovibrio escacola]
MAQRKLTKIVIVGNYRAVKKKSVKIGVSLLLITSAQQRWY